MGGFKQWYKVILVNIVLILLLFGALEFVVSRYTKHNRTFDERKTYNVNFVPSAYSKSNFASSQKSCAYLDDRINYDSIRFQFNSYGYRGPEFPLKKDSDEIRIAILGGSHVADPNCFDYEGNPGFSQEIQKKLRLRGYKVTVINAGVAGASTTELLMRAHLDISRYQPDFVVINCMWNDLKWITTFGKETQLIKDLPMAVEKNPLSEKVSILDDLFAWSVAYRKIRDFYWLRKLNFSYDNKKINEGIIKASDIKAQAKNGNFDEGVKQYKSNVVLLTKIIKQFNAEPILAIEESLISANNTEEEKSKIHYDYMNVKTSDELVSVCADCSKVIVDVAEANNVKLIDIGPSIKKLEYFADHVHMTPLGSKKTANFYADFFEKIIAAKSDSSLASK